MSINSILLRVVQKTLKRGLWAPPDVCAVARSFRRQDAPAYLKAILLHAAKHVPYYADQIDANADLISQFKSLPVLTKAIIRDNSERLKSDDLAARKWFLNSSGGSTGRPTTIVQDQVYLDWSHATESLFYSEFLGVPDFLFVPKLYLWGSERDLFRQETVESKLQNFLENRLFINTFKMQESDMRRAVDIINRRRPVYIKGYAGSLYQLAQFAKGQNLVIRPPRAVYSAAEMLRPFMREAIQEAFGCKVFDFYGSREVGPMAGECPMGRMHIFQFNNYIEVVDKDNQPVQPGMEGRVLVTTLHNFAMPLIRYDIGDTAVLGEDCKCGSQMPTLGKITGRTTDHFITSDGTLVNGEYFTHLFYFREWVDEFQVVQEKVDAISINYVPRCAASEQDLDDINGKIRLVMGVDCRIEWHQVDEIPRTPQGKLLFTRCLVNTDKISEEPVK
jgi:phenylacetate-CoA ligase